jgi:sec-independent protein translocase protein TatC
VSKNYFTPDMQEEKRFTLIEHLEELRQRLMISFAAVAIFSLFCYRHAKGILDALSKPVEKLVFIAPLELFFVYLKIAIIGGLLLASPIIFFEIWRFVSIGLLPRERKNVLLFFPFSLLLFFLGGAFAYFTVIPFGIRFLLSFGTEKITPMISVGRYISFVGILVFATGLVFELPVVVLFLTKVGLVTPRMLRHNRKFVVVLIFIIAAVVTPTPDVFTQCLLAFPMLILYEISVWLSYFVWKKKPAA